MMYRFVLIWTCPGPGSCSDGTRPDGVLFSLDSPPPLFVPFFVFFSSFFFSSRFSPPFFLSFLLFLVRMGVFGILAMTPLSDVRPVLFSYSYF